MDLLTVQDLEQHVGPPIEAFTNEQIAAAVADTNEAIPEHCDRIFDDTEYREWVDARAGSKKLFPRGYPITALYRFAEADEGLKIQYTDSTAVQARVTVHAGKLVLVKPDATVVEITLSSYATLALLKTQIETNANWSAEVLDEGIPQDIRPLAGGNALSPEYTTLEIPGVPVEMRLLGERALERVSGEFDGGPKTVFEHYKAGYTTVPKRLNRIAREVAHDLLLSLTRDPGVKSESLEGYRWTAAEVADIVLRHTPALKPWRNESEV